MNHLLIIVSTLLMLLSGVTGLPPKRFPESIYVRSRLSSLRHNMLEYPVVQMEMDEKGNVLLLSCDCFPVKATVTITNVKTQKDYQREIWLSKRTVHVPLPESGSEDGFTVAVKLKSGFVYLSKTGKNR